MTDHVCGCGLFYCHCVVAADVEHEVHVCSCGGSWTGENGDVVVVSLPSFSSVIRGLLR